MALNFVKPLLIMLAIIVPPTLAKVLSGKNFHEWFAAENNPFTYGIPITKEAWFITIAVLTIIILALVTITNYVS